jgi:hypothetical protein
MPNFDYLFLDSIAGEMKHFVELLDIWLPPRWYDPAVTVASVRSALPDYSFVAYRSTLSYDGITYRPITAVRSSIKETQSGEDVSMSLSLDGIGYITPEPLIITGLTDAQVATNFTQYPDGSVIKSSDGNFFLRDGSSLTAYNTPKSLNLMLREMEIRGARIRLRRIPLPYRGTTYTTTPKMLFRGYIASYSYDPRSITFECCGLLHKWGASMVPARLMGPGCQVPFGSSACVVIESQGESSLSGVVTDAGIPAIIASQDVSFPDVGRYQVQDALALSAITNDNHFGNGYVIIVDVNHPYENYKGRYSRVRSFDASTSTLFLSAPLPLPEAVLASPATYNVSLAYRATCGKTKSECKRWQNLDNYKGMDVPKVPTLSLGMELY